MKTFEEWWEAYCRAQVMSPDEHDLSIGDVKAAFNAGRTEGHPRVWRYKKVKGQWMVEFLDNAPVKSGPVEKT